MSMYVNIKGKFTREWFFTNFTVLNFLTCMCKDRTVYGGFSWEWICESRWCFCENDCWHVVHWYGFWPVCVMICLFRADLAEKDLRHVLHSNSFSPVWVRMWVTRVDFSENDFWHVLHWYSFWPVCVRICLSMLDFCETCRTLVGFTPVRVRKWTFTLYRVLNSFWHKWQSKFLL